MLRIPRLPCIIALVTMGPACGSRRLANALEELENYSASGTETDATGTSHSAGSSGDTSSSQGSDGMTMAGSETTSTSTGMTDPAETTAESTGTTTGTTGEPVAMCGNGVLEAFGPVPEECDDGNMDPDDGCGATCAIDIRVFVTSVRYKGAQLESLKLADSLCWNLADDQGWPDALTYRAWLSTNTTDARDRFKQGRGRLVLVNGLVLAQSWPALLAGELENPFEVTEKSETYHGRVWTGTRPDGTAVPGAMHCDDWSSDSFLKSGHYGYSDRTTPEWTLSASTDNPSGCNSNNALYCLQTL